MFFVVVNPEVPAYRYCNCFDSFEEAWDYCLSEHMPKGLPFSVHESKYDAGLFTVPRTSHNAEVSDHQNLKPLSTGV
jgi:hypothetical protein